MVSIRTIFFPASDAAVSYAAGLAANYEATIRLLHVITPIAAGAYEYAIDTAELVASMEESSMAQMNKLVAGMKESGVVAEPEVRIGDVYDEIKRDIELLKPDLVVMGTHGRRGVQRWFMGSTTEKLLRLPACHDERGA
jgi:nucleotide-binding universal stress UspA family protein